MTVYFNNEAIVLNNTFNLLELLNKKDFSNKKGIAVAVNNKVVKRSNWELHQLSENDKVLVISATKGG